MRQVVVWGFALAAAAALFTSAQAQRSDPPTEAAGSVTSGEIALPEGDPGFWELSCVDTQVSDSRATNDTFGPARSALENRLLVGIRAKLPRLKVTSSCGNSLRLSLVGLRTRNKGGVDTGWAAYVGLDLVRIVQVKESGFLTIGAVWESGGIQIGPLDSANGPIYEQIDELVDSFAAEYYKAKNN